MNNLKSLADFAAAILGTKRRRSHSTLCAVAYAAIATIVKRKMNTAKVIYVLDENNEATDVLWFCSSACRKSYAVTSTEIDVLPHADGDNPDFVDGTVCEYCGNQIHD